MSRPYRWLTLALATMLLNGLAGCLITLPASTPIRPAAAAHGITLVRTLLAELPDRAVAVPDESPAGLLVPVPFVADAISGVFDHNVAEGLEQRYTNIEHVIVRLPGFMGLAGTSGGLFYGTRRCPKLFRAARAGLSLWLMRHVGKVNATTETS